MQNYQQAEEHYKQLEQLDRNEARWAVMVAACLHAHGLAAKVDLDI